MLLYSVAAASLPPYLGDSMLSGFMSTLDAEAQEAMRRLRIGILTLISGSDEFFVIVVCDKGYVFVPGNAATDFITFLKDLCRQVKMRLEKPARNNSDIFFHISGWCTIPGSDCWNPRIHLSNQSARANCPQIHCRLSWIGLTHPQPQCSGVFCEEGCGAR